MNQDLQQMKDANLARLIKTLLGNSLDDDCFAELKHVLDKMSNPRQEG